jgi:hypothetical protein
MEEEEEMEREGVPAPTRRPAWVNPYEGQPELEEFLGGKGHRVSRYCLIMERRTLQDVCTTTM